MPVASVVSDSVQPHGQQPTRLLCAQDSLGKNTGVGCHFLLQLGGWGQEVTDSRSRQQKPNNKGSEGQALTETAKKTALPKSLLGFCLQGSVLWQLCSSLVAQLVKSLPPMQRTPLNPWIGKIPWRRDGLPTPVFLGFPGGSAGKEPTCNARDLGSTPGLGRSPGGGLGNPVQYSCLENPQGQRSLAGSKRSQRVRHDWAMKHIITAGHKDRPDSNTVSSWLIISAMTLSANKVTFWNTGTYDFNVYFLGRGWGGGTIQPIVFLLFLSLLPIYRACDGLPWWPSGKESACQCRRRGFNPWVRKISWRRKWLPPHSSILAWEISWTEEPGRLQYSLWGCEELDTT